MIMLDNKLANSLDSTPGPLLDSRPPCCMLCDRDSERERERKEGRKETKKQRKPGRHAGRQTARKGEAIACLEFFQRDMWGVLSVGFAKHLHKDPRRYVEGSEGVYASDPKIRNGSMPQHASRFFKEIRGTL